MSRGKLRGLIRRGGRPMVGSATLFDGVTTVEGDPLLATTGVDLPTFVPKSPHTRHRRTDPDTSKEAAGRAARITETRLRILELLDSDDGYEMMTDDEIAASARAEGWFTSPSGLRTRRSELVESGLVADSGERSTLPTGRRAVLWRITEKGRQAAEGIRS